MVHGHAVFQAVADPQSLDRLLELAGEGVMDAVVHIDAVGAHAGIWPLLRYLAIRAPSAALSRSASSKTMKGVAAQFRDISFTSWALGHQLGRPMWVEPVNVSLRTIGCR